MSPIVNLIIFAGLACAMIVISIMAITTKSLLRSATYLLLTLICTAGLYVFLNYHFLAAVQVGVYAGGVVVLFIFAIFLTSQKDAILSKNQTKKYIYGALTSIIGVLMVGFVIFKSKFIYTDNTTMLGDMEVPMHDIGIALMGTNKYQYLLPFEILSVLLLAAIIGGLVIAKKEQHKNEEKTEE